MVKISQILSDFQADLRDSPRWDAGFALFWIIGPFLYLIERSPADAWLSLIAIGFIAQSARSHEWGWLREGWIKAVGFFWGVALVASALSDNIGYSVGEAVVWIRFPLYAAACIYWIGHNRARLHMMLAAMAVAAFIMAVILAVEVWQTAGMASRLSGPYGDLIPGSYLGKAMMPLAIVLCAAAMRFPLFLGLFPAMGAGGILIATLLTGERVNTALCGCALVLAALASKQSWNRIAFFAVMGCAALVATFTMHPGSHERYLTEKTEVTNYFESAYWFSVRPGIVSAIENPILGIGVGMHRLECQNIGTGPEWLPGENGCHPHPHQFYVQLAQETGIIGLIAGVIMIGCIIATSAKGANTGSVLARLAWIPPVLLFFPQPSADFFGQWNNLFLWFAVGLALAMSRDKKAEK